MTTSVLRNFFAAAVDSRQSITIYPITRRDVLILVIILLAGAALRFSRPDVIDWSKDHSDMAMPILDMLSGKAGIPLVGQPSSARIPHSPFYIYILAIPYTVTHDPVAVTMFISALNLVGVAILWWIALRYFGSTVALIAALAYAVNPWVVGFSRSIWSGDHRAPLLLLGVALALYGFIEGKRWAQIWCLPVMLVALQVHFAAYPLIVLYGWLLWVGRRKTTRQTLVISLILGAAVVAPFSIGIVRSFTTEQPVTESFQAVSRELSIRELIKPYGQLVWLATGLGTEQYGVRENADDMLREAGLPIWLWIAQGMATVVGVAAIWRYVPRYLGIFVMLWAFWQVVFFTLPILGVFPHYFIPAIPALALLAGIGVRFVLDLTSRLLPAGSARLAGAAVWAVFGLVFVTQGAMNLFSTDYAARNFSPSQFGMGVMVGRFEEAADLLKPFSNVIVVASDDWLENSRANAWVMAPFLYDTAVCLRDVVINSNQVVLPAGAFAVMYAPRLAADPVLDSLYQNGQPQRVNLREGEGTLDVYTFDQPLSWNGPALLDIVPATFENGLQLTQYHLDANRLTLSWRLPAAHSPDYEYNIQWLDADGQMLGEVTGALWPSKNWCAGDQLIAWTDVETPAGAVTMQVTVHSDRSLSLVDATGAVTGEAVEISLQSS